MRENTKWIFYILVAAFVAWLVVDVGAGITGRGNYASGDVILKVNGDAVHLAEYQNAYQSALEQIRQQNRSGPLSREDEQELQNQVVEQLIQGRLLRQAYDRLGLRASEREIQDAARSTPPPELMQTPQFQTNGQFDPAKWQRFLASGADPQFLLALETRYREEIPRVKLAQYLTSDVYVTDAKLWRIYRDQYDSVTAQVVAIWPSTVRDSEVTITDADLERYLRAHEKDFKRGAIAHLTYVPIPRAPDGVDSAAARARALRVRTEAARSATAFADVAKRESADSGSAEQGGDLGWFRPATVSFDPTFVRAVKQMHAGETSLPVQTRFGFHVIRIDEARGDSVHARHILIPIELRPERRDSVEARADTLDRLAATQTNGAILDSVSRTMHLPLAKAPPLTEGNRLQLGRDEVPDVGVWAFEAKIGETSPVIEGPSAYYVFRLDSLIPAGVPPVDALRDVLTAAVRTEKKNAVLDTRAREIYEELRDAPDLLAAGTAKGLPAQSWGPMNHLRAPGYLGREPVVLGAAFGLDVGKRSGLIKGRDGYYVVQVTSRHLADSTAWRAQRDVQREQLMQAARQARIRAYIDDLRTAAKVVDRRKELFRPATQAGA
jgi:peptidyl-prolyl cis-trans isomerase D